MNQKTKKKLRKQINGKCSNTGNKYDLKICDDGTLIQILCFWTLSIALFLFKTQRFGDWILSPSSGKI
jgi:hypothetical protein